ncbi:hypothetical protein QFZ55_006789 [Streptomyces luteogriseus]|nr:hypothetical protein [Streptomyces luteogriseus]
MRGTRRPGALSTSGARTGVRAELVVDGDGVGVQVEQAAAAADGDGQVAQVAEGEAAGDVVRVRGEGHDAVAVREAQGAAVGAVAPLLHAGYGRRGEVAEEVVGVERGAERQPQGEHAWGARALPSGGAGAQLARGQREDLADRVVEGADRGEAGGEGDLRHGQGGRLDEQPGRLGALGAGEREGARAQLGEELALDLPGAVAEPAGEAGHSLAVHDAVGDQPHGAGHEVGALVPLRGAGAGVGPAALAGPEPGLLTGRRAGVEDHVLRLGRHHRAAGTAVDAGGQDGREEPAVEACVLGPDGAYAALGVGVHPHLHGSRIGHPAA